MSRVVNRAPLAITSNGEVLLNVVELDVPSRLSLLLRAAEGEPGSVFIGVELASREVRRLLRQLNLILPNATWPVGGRRIARRRRAQDGERKNNKKKN